MLPIMKRPSVFSPSPVAESDHASAPDQPLRPPHPSHSPRTRRYVALALSLALLTAIAWWARGADTPQAPPESMAQTFERLLQEKGWPSPARPAIESVAGAVVMVKSHAPDPKLKGREVESGVGTGVVVHEDGMILTNLHVVWGATRLTVTFADGTESPARVVATQPNNDLAVLKPQKIPDDLQPATLGSSR